MKVVIFDRVSGTFDTLVGGYIISEVEDDGFSINGRCYTFTGNKNAEAARAELIAKLEGAEPKPNLMANPALTVEALQAENTDLKQWKELALAKEEVQKVQDEKIIKLKAENAKLKENVITCRKVIKTTQDQVCQYGEEIRTLKGLVERAKPLVKDINIVTCPSNYTEGNNGIYSDSKKWLSDVEAWEKGD